MDQSSLIDALHHLPLNEIVYLPTVGSTNDEVIKQGQRSVEPFSLVVANEQTKGRGRSGRSWSTPPGTAIAMSLRLPTNHLEASQLTKITGVGALAVCEGLQKLGLSPKIKWPNDVLLDGKKVCGVLAEAHWHGDKLENVVIGIGINIATASVPPAENLNFPATSVEAQLGHAIRREELIGEVLTALFDWWPKLGKTDFMIAWESQLAFMDETVEIVSADNQDEVITGTVKGLNGQGHIRLLLATGEEKSFEASEIHLRPRVDSPAN